MTRDDCPCIPVPGLEDVWINTHCPTHGLFARLERGEDVNMAGLSVILDD